MTTTLPPIVGDEDALRWAVEEAVQRDRPHRRSPAQPRYCTPRNPERRTLGGELLEVIRMLGFEPLPWQGLVADIALEIDEHGDLVYREIVLIVPRQSGKTVLLLALRVWRALNGARHWGRRQSTIYTAQTRNDAVKKFLDVELPILKESPFGPHYKERRARGAEGLSWRNGSRHDVEPTTKKAGHGKTVDQAEIDEAFAVPDSRLEDGVKPTMLTRRSPQIWIVSAVGDDSDETQPSEWLKGKVEAGRARCAVITETVDAGGEMPTFVSAYFEWSADEGQDPGDPETWWGCMPALGITQPEKAVAADFQTMPLATFKRAYLCIWPGARRHVRLIDDVVWASPRHLVDVRDELQLEASQFVGPLVLAVDASPGCETASLVVGGRRADGAPQVEVVKRADGATWVADDVATFVKATRATVVMGSKSPAAAVLPDLAALHIKVDLLSMEEVFRAAEAFMISFTEGDGRHLGQPELDSAVDVAIKRMYADRFAFGRSDGGGDISPLNAASLALWRALHPGKGPARVRWL
jgi:hypothetical protein